LNKSRTLLLITILLLAASVPALGQASGTATTQQVDGKSSVKRVVGEVTTIDQGHGQLSVKTASGASVTVKLDEKTLYRRVPAGETTLDKAVSIKSADISVGDRVIARGMTGDSSLLLARELIVIAGNDINEKHKRDRDEWMKRGLTGRVTALDPAKKEITISARAHEAESTIVITVGEKAAFRRYSPDSLRFRDAQESSFAGLKVGDQLRALGDKSADGTHFAAEEIISGTFRTVIGKITSINAQTGEVTVSNTQTQQPLIILLNKDSRLRRLSPEAVGLLVQRMTAQGGNAAGQTVGAGTGQHGADLQESIENLPSLAIGDLKPGDAVLVSAAAGSPERATAILFTVGADEIVKRMSQSSTRRNLNLELGLPNGVDP
jgi:co-chaperonin GroES (HSP10)